MERASTTRHRRAAPGGGWTREEGYGVPPLRFASGDLLALRVRDGAAEVWHRPPGGGWSAHADARVAWQGRELAVRAPSAGLSWTLRLRTSSLTRLANSEVERVSFELHGPAGAEVRLRVQGAGGRGPLPPDRAGVQGVLLPSRIRVVGASEAVVEGRKAGAAVSGPTPLMDGFFPWRAPGVLVEGTLLRRVRTAGGLRRAG